MYCVGPVVFKCRQNSQDIRSRRIVVVKKTKHVIDGRRLGDDCAAIVLREIVNKPRYLLVECREPRVGQINIVETNVNEVSLIMLI